MISTGVFMKLVCFKNYKFYYNPQYSNYFINEDSLTFFLLPNMKLEFI